MGTADVEVVKTRAVFEDGRLRYVLYELEGGAVRYKAVRLRELVALPRPPRDEQADLDILMRTRTALRGLYDAEVDLAYLAAGMFSGEEFPPYGLVQVYGVVGGGNTAPEAVHAAEVAEGALQGVLANFIGLVTRPLSHDKTRFILQAIEKYPYAVVVLGQPDAREAPVSPDRQVIEKEKPAEQNELVFRGLARLREDFVYFVLARRVPRADAARLLEAALTEASAHASLASGSRSVNLFFSIPYILNRADGVSAGRGHTESQAHSNTEGTAQSWGRSHSEGTAETTGYAHTEGVSESWGEAHTVGRATSVVEGEATSTSHTESRGESWGEAHTEGTAHTSGSGVTHSSSVTSVPTISSVTNSVGGSWSLSTGESHTTGEAVTDTASSGTASSETSVHTEGTGTSTNTSYNFGASANLGVNAGLQGGVSGSAGFTQASGTTETSSDATGSGLVTSVGSSHAETASSSTGRSTGMSLSGSWSRSVTTTPAHTITSSSTSTSSFSSTTRSSSDTTSHGRSQATSDGVSHSTSWSRATTTSEAHTTSHAVGRSSADTWSRSTTRSQSDGWSLGFARSRAESYGTAAASARSLARSLSAGVTTGLTSGIGLSKSYNWSDEVQAFLADLFRRVARLADTMAAEGGYEVETYLLTRSERGARASEALAVQAFHGLEDVVIPVTTVTIRDDEREHVAGHIATFTPCRLPPPGGAASVLAGGRYSTAMTLTQLAALVAPAVFEQGTAATTIQRPPDFAFYPELPGEVILGYQFSQENYTGERPTRVPARLSMNSFYSFAVVGDSGTGKTTFGERLVLETTLKWRIRSLVLDLGAGWERILNAPGIGDIPRQGGVAEHVTLSPFSANPIRFNPLAVPLRIEAGEYYKALADIMGGTTGMGVVQVGIVQDLLRELYVEAGVLLSEEEVVRDPRWNVISDEEAEAINEARRAAGVPPRTLAGRSIRDLRPKERAVLAHLRSQRVDVAEMLERLARKRAKAKMREEERIHNIILRLQDFGNADVYERYRPLRDGERATPVESLAEPWGLTIISGGWGIAETMKAFLIGLIAWIVYHDAAARLQESGVLPHRGLHIFIDEIQKLFKAAEDDAASTASTALVEMWPDSRKYGIALSAGVQNPSVLPIQILSNCNNIAAFRLKHPDDRNVIAEMMGWSSRGFRDVASLTYLGTMAKWRCFLHYANHPLGDLGRKPMLIQPLRVPGRAATEREVAAMYGRSLW